MKAIPSSSKSTKIKKVENYHYFRSVNPTVKNILLQHDEYGCYETPSVFNYDFLMSEVNSLCFKLENEFGLDFKINDQVQDASFICDIKIPKELVIKYLPDIGYSIRVSNYGKLVTINFKEKYSEEVLQKLVDIITQSEFVYISTDDLEEGYDGSFPEAVESSSNWYTRYFGYL